MPHADPTAAALAEATVVGRAQDGDVASFEVLVRRYSGPVYRLATRMLGDRGEAEDVVQDTFVIVWRRLPTLVDPTVFRSWVYQVATRRCLGVLRTRARRSTLPLEADDLQAAQDAHPDGRTAAVRAADDPAASAEHTAHLRGLDAALAALPAEQRACWVLREMHDLPYAEIAYVMHLPVSTVRGRIARARQNLAKGMSAWR